jgi:hypothetical protein
LVCGHATAKGGNSMHVAPPYDVQYPEATLGHRSRRNGNRATHRNDRKSARSKTGPLRTRRPVALDPRRIFGLIPAAGAIAAIVLLAVTILTGPVADAGHPVITVDGHVIDRTALRARLVLDRTLADVRATLRRSAQAAEMITSAEASTPDLVDQAVAEDPVRAAIDGLARDAVVNAQAADRGLLVIGNQAEEVATDAGRDFGVRIMLVVFKLPSSVPSSSAGDWPRPPTNANPETPASELERAAADRLLSALASGLSSTDAVGYLNAAGWSSWTEERWLPVVGPAEGVAPELVGQARDPRQAIGSAVGPIFDAVTGTASVALVVARDGPNRAIAQQAIDDAHIDQAYLSGWATTRAQETALRTQLAADWTSTPQERVRASELVVGSSSLEGPAGPFVSFAHVVVDQLPAAQLSGSDLQGSASVLRDELRGLDLAGRLNRFDQLVEAANKTPTTDPVKSSGELGYYTHDQLVPELGDAAFAGTTRVGDVLGPVATAAGQELFIVRARFAGVLDDRTNIVLTEARTSKDLQTLSARVSPVGTTSRSAGVLWRALDEFAGSPAAGAAFRETAIEEVSEPFVFGGEVVVIRPLARETSRLDSGSVSRLVYDGFEGWLAAAVSVATVIRDPEPLPGIRVDPAPSASASLESHSPIGVSKAPPTTGPQPTSAFGIPTPRTIP